jgi:hypothetical protein
MWRVTGCVYLDNRCKGIIFIGIIQGTLGGITFFGISGLVLGPLLGALFQPMLMIYNVVFSDWLTG